MQKEYLIYYGSILLAAFFAWLAQKFAKDKKGKFKLNKFFWILSIAVLTIVIGLRKSGVGVDDWQYEQIYNRVRVHGPIVEFLQETMEPGYLILNYIVGIFTSNFQVFLFIVSLISILFYYKAIEYERKNVNLFLVVFLFGTIMYLYFFGIIRLFLASSIIAYSLRYVFEKKSKKFIIFTILATSIHYSATFMLFLLYFSTEKEEKPRKIRDIVLLIVIGMPILILVVTQLIFPMMGQRYEHYLTLSGIKLSIDQFDKIPIVILSVIFYKQMKLLNRNARIYIVICALTTVISIYSTMVDIGRIQWYLNFSICILLPLIARSMNMLEKYKYWNIFFMPIILIYGVIFAYRIVFLQESNIYMTNYSNILF